MFTGLDERVGSSPRMRGALKCSRWKVFLTRIIPAYAGSTQLNTLFDKWTKDHPRVCGEHTPAILSKACWAGSSPRMRGAH